MEASSTCWTPANYFYKVILSQWIKEQSTTLQIYPTQAYQSLPTLSIRPQRKPWSTTCCIPTRHQSTHHRSLSFQTLVHAATYLHFFQCLSVLQRDASPTKLVWLKLFQPIPSQVRCSSSHQRSATSSYLYASIQTVMSLCECNREVFSSNKRGCCFSTTVGFPHRPHQFSSIVRAKVLQYLKNICLKHQEAQKVTPQPFQRLLAQSKTPFFPTDSLQACPGLANIHQQQQTTSSTSPSSTHHVILQHHTGQLSASSPAITIL